MPGLSPTQQAEIREKARADAAKMRGDMARHKPPSGPLDIKLGEGGLVALLRARGHTVEL